MPLELGDPGTLLALSRDTAPQITGPVGGPALQCGANIQQDKVRYVWRLNVQNIDGGGFAHTLFVFAGDVVNTVRRLILATTIAPFASVDMPLNGAHVQNHMFKVPPVTSLPIAPPGAIQEEGIYITDEAGGAQIQVVLSQYDLRG